MNKPIISIIVPIYNVEKYLKRCIDSILAQSFTDFELILVDDGSLDNCPQMCDDYAKKDSRIKVIHKKNGGVSSARNAGLDIAQGEYISFCDSDDVPCCKWLELLYKAIINDGVDLAICDYYEEFADENIESLSNNDFCLESNLFKVIDRNQILELYDNRLINTPWNKIFKFKIIKNNFIRFDENISFGEDLLFICRYIQKCNMNFVLCNKKLYIYNKGIEGSLSNKYVENMWTKRKHVQMVLWDTFRCCNVDIDNNKEYYYRKWADIILWCLNNSDLYATKKQCRENYQEILNDDICKETFRCYNFKNFNLVTKWVYKTRSYFFIKLYLNILNIIKSLK